MSGFRLPPLPAFGAGATPIQPPPLFFWNWRDSQDTKVSVPRGHDTQL